MSIGERKKPAPNGIPGYLRIDTVHQGDGPEGKGIYHINAVDEVTQWQVVAATPSIRERYLLPVLGLVETKNGAIIRKYIGFGHIAPAHADRVNHFHSSFLNHYVNFHRPSAQPEVEMDAKGRKRRRYKQWLTPLEKLLSLDQPEQYLRPRRSLEALKRHAAALSDTEAAERLQRARDQMFRDLAAQATATHSPKKTKNRNHPAWEEYEIIPTRSSQRCNLQAHSALEPNRPLRLISGLENTFSTA